MNKRDIVEILLWGICLGLVIVGVFLFLTGCHKEIITPTIITVPGPAEILYKTVVKTNWLATASLIGIVVSVFALLNGSKMGLAGIGASCAGLFLTLAVARFAFWLAIVGLVGSIAIGLWSVFIKTRALTEIIEGIQAIKNRYKDVSYISPAAFKVQANTILANHQSDSTVKIVETTKEKLNLNE